MSVFCVFYPGSYESAETLIAIFSTQEKAARYVMEYNKCSAVEDVYYEEIEVDNEEFNVVAKNVYYVFVDKEGKIKELKTKQKLELVQDSITGYAVIAPGHNINIYSYISKEHAKLKAIEALRTYQLGKYHRIQFTD